MAARSYDEEQLALRRKQGLEEESAEDDFHIEAPKGLPEVNPEVFRDVEPLLFRGFVYAQAVINEVPFVFKSLNHHEFEYLALMGGLQGPRNIVARNLDYFLALGVLMMNGVNVLADRENWLPQIAEMFRSFGEGPRRKVVFHLSEINRRASRAVTLSEAFAIEPQSRLRWAQFQGLNLSAPSVTGFYGTDVLGLNWGQLTWRAINHFEDRREQIEREWENSKFVASAMAGKGMAKVYAQDRRRRQTEREETLARRDRIIRFALLNESPSSGSKDGQNIVVARTVEELATQLERDLKGEKDWHDMVVDRYEQQARQAHEQRIEIIRNRYQEHEAEFGNRGVVAGERDMRQQGYTQDEVRQQIERRRQLAAQRMAAAASLPELHDPKMSQFIDKWANAGAKTPLPTDRLKGLPFRRDGE
jgi:hypothetical protein